MHATQGLFAKRTERVGWRVAGDTVLGQSWRGGLDHAAIAE